MTTSQRLAEANLNAAIRRTQEDICCTGKCNENQGLGECPRYRAQPSDASWNGAHMVIYAIALVIACVGMATLLSGCGGGGDSQITGDQTIQPVNCTQPKSCT